MDLTRLRTALLLAAAPVLCVGCGNDAKTCNEFFDVAAPIMSSVAVPKPAPSGSAAIDWARDAAKQYQRLAQEAEKISERTGDSDVKAWRDEVSAAREVSKQLDELAQAAASVEPSKVATVKSALLNAARSEGNAARAIELHCAK
jgi:hypothetical protein